MATPTSSDNGESPPATRPRLQAGRRAETVQQAQLRWVKAGEQAQLTCTCGQDNSGDLSDQGYLGHEVWSVSVQSLRGKQLVLTHVYYDTGPEC